MTVLATNVKIQFYMHTRAGPERQNLNFSGFTQKDPFHDRMQCGSQLYHRHQSSLLNEALLLSVES